MSEATNAAQVAVKLASALDSIEFPYAIGGAIALGYWGQPRGTLDVDVTLFVPGANAAETVELLRGIGCEIEIEKALSSLREHGFCQASLDGFRLDVFLPTIDFYEEAKRRTRRVPLGEHEITIWDAETLVVFKLMFFRRKDLADIEQILTNSIEGFDADWVTRKIREIYGARDPRVTTWQELLADFQ